MHKPLKALGKKLTLFAILLLMTGNNVSHARPEPQKSPALKKVRQQYYQALADGDAVDKGIKSVKKARDLPEALSKAYEGSFLCLEARDSFWPLRKWNRANEGLQLLDKAVQLDKKSLEVRVLRAAVTSHLPGFFGRSSEAKQDIFWIKQRMEKDDELQEDEKLMKFVQSFLSDYFKKNG